MVESTFSKVNSTGFHQVNRAVDWWGLPLPAALLNLRVHRDDPSKPLPHMFDFFGIRLGLRPIA